jgi:hypothetical protein
MRALLQCLFVVSGISMISCSDEPSQIGSEFFDGGSLALSTVDTITLETSTVTFDSLITNDATRLLVGAHKDDDLGVISSSGFFQMGVAGALSIDKEYTTFTRVEMRLVHDGYSYYDTATSMTVSVHRLTEAIELPSADPHLYNTSTIDYDATPMGTVTFKARPNTKDTVTIPLSEDFGRDLMALAQSAATEVSTSGDFIEYFDGFALIPHGIDGPVVGFATNVQVRVYYNDKSITPNVEKYMLLQSNGNLLFNKIISDRSDTDLDGLTDQRYPYGSKITGGKSYMQSGSGLGIRVSIPYLRRILIDNPDLNIINAVLSISPARENTGANTPLPSTLVMSMVDYRNQLIISYDNNALVYQDYYLDRDTHYEVDITAFIKSQLSIEEFNDNALVFTTDATAFTDSIDRLYAGDQMNDRPMKLTLTCLTYLK